jgi:hypothetical protein
MPIQAYPTKSKKLPGTNYSEVYKKDKIFLGLFWQHLHDKLNLKDKTRRAKYFSCALELIQNTKFDPISKKDPNSKTDILHRFTGITSEKEIFFVQIKEDKKTAQKFLISVFPFDK